MRKYGKVYGSIPRMVTIRSQRASLGFFLGSGPDAAVNIEPRVPPGEEASAHSGLRSCLWTRKSRTSRAKNLASRESSIRGILWKVPLSSTRPTPPQGRLETAGISFSRRWRRQKRLISARQLLLREKITRRARRLFRGGVRKRIVAGQKRTRVWWYEASLPPGSTWHACCRGYR